MSRAGRQGLVGELQEKAARAMPAPVQQDHGDGCWLRHTEGPSWWVGASLVHDPVGGAALLERVTAVEDFYAEHGGPVRVQVCPACPAELGALLAGRGYAAGAEVSLQVGAADDVVRRLPPTALQVELAERPDTAWLAAWAAIHDGDPAAERRLLSQVEQASCYVTAVSSGKPVAVGRAVADGGWTGAFGMATLPTARRQGAAGAVLVALAGWAVEQRAPRAYLQVEVDNSAATALYARAGFRQLCRYHYRTSPGPQGSAP